MKWTNKGHQFDALGNNFKKRNKILIYGACEIGKFIFEELCKYGLENSIDGFIDRNFNLLNGIYCDKKVYSPDIIFNKFNEKHTIIVAVTERSKAKIFDRLKRAGYIYSLDFFSYEDFILNLNNIYVPVFAMYTQNRLLISSACVIPSTVCNLRCKHCLNFTPHITNFETRELKSVYNDIDILFKWVDYTNRFQISGGEPLLYPKFNQLAQYIGEKYRNKIDIFETVLNGTIIPSDTSCEIMKQYNMTVYLDNYTDSIPEKLNKRIEIIQQLEKYNIQWIDNSVDEWFDLDIFNTDNTCMSDTELTEYFDTCNNPWHCYENGRMYGCNFDRFATKAGLNKETENSYFDLNKMNEGQKKEFLEFTLNYNNNGYVELCKHCAGWAEMNKNKVPVAIQC